MFVESDEQLHLSKTHYVKHQLKIWRNSNIFLDDLKVGSCSTTIENIVLSSPPHPFYPSSMNAQISLFTLIFNAASNLFSFTIKAVFSTVMFSAEPDAWVARSPASIVTESRKVVGDSVELLCPGLGDATADRWQVVGQKRCAVEEDTG
ncbi:hypothetical protein YC2023_124700 [Brassica napus]